MLYSCHDSRSSANRFFNWAIFYWQRYTLFFILPRKTVFFALKIEKRWGCFTFHLSSHTAHDSLFLFASLLPSSCLMQERTHLILAPSRILQLNMRHSLYGIFMVHSVEHFRRCLWATPLRVCGQYEGVHTPFTPWCFSRVLFQSFYERIWWQMRKKVLFLFFLIPKFWRRRILDVFLPLKRTVLASFFV